MCARGSGLIDGLLEVAALFLLANLFAGLARVYLGPGPADRVQGVLLIGTSTVAILLLAAYSGDRDALINVALVFVMLAAWLAIAFAVVPNSHGGGRKP